MSRPKLYERPTYNHHSTRNLQRKASSRSRRISEVIILDDGSMGNDSASYDSDDSLANEDTVNMISFSTINSSLLNELQNQKKRQKNINVPEPSSGRLHQDELKKTTVGNNDDIGKPPEENDDTEKQKIASQSSQSQNSPATLIETENKSAPNLTPHYSLGPALLKRMIFVSYLAAMCILIAIITGSLIHSHGYDEKYTTSANNNNVSPSSFISSTPNPPPLSSTTAAQHDHRKDDNSLSTTTTTTDDITTTVSPAPHDLVAICSNSTIESYSRCRSICLRATCCNAPRFLENCYGGNEDACKGYAKGCRLSWGEQQHYWDNDVMVMKDEGGRDGSNNESFFNVSDEEMIFMVGVVCQDKMMEKVGGRKVCEDLCKGRSCCFEGDGEDEWGDDESDFCDFDDCEDYAPCEILQGVV